MEFLLICGVVLLTVCAIIAIYTDNRIDYRLPRYTWAMQEQMLYTRQRWTKHMTTAGVILTVAGMIGLLLGY